MTLKKAVEAIESNPSLKKQFIQNCIEEIGEYTYQEIVVWNDEDIENVVVFRKQKIDFSEHYFKEALELTLSTIEESLNSPDFDINQYNINKICRDIFEGHSRREIAVKHNISPWYAQNIVKEFRKHLKAILDRAT